MLLEGNVGADRGVDNALHLTYLLGRHLLEVGEVEAQVVGHDERTLLLDVGAQHTAQRVVEQVSGGVVGFAAGPPVLVYLGGKLGLGVLRQGVGDMQSEIVLALGVDDIDGLLGGYQAAAVAYLSAHLGIERRHVEHYLIVFLVLLHHGAVACDVALVRERVPADKLFLALVYRDPVARLYLCSSAGSVLLLLHLLVKALLVYLESVLRADELREVERESERVKERECLDAGDLLAAGFLGLGHDVVQHVDACGQGAQESVFLLLNDVDDELLLRLELRIGVAHLVDERRHELVHERFLLAEECIGVAHGAAQDAAYHIARLGVGGQLPVGDGERDGADVVGHHAHGDVRLLVLAVLHVRQLANLADDGLEDVGVVVGILVLQHTAEALKAHARVDDLGRQRLE